MSISQLNASHVRSEDRLLLRINTPQDEEYRLWLTRLVTGDLLSRSSELLQQAIAQELHAAKAAALSQFGQDAMQGELKTGGFRPARRLPLGAEPQLVTGCALDHDGQLYALKMQLPTREFSMPLIEAQLRKLVLLLDRIQKQAGWGLESVAASPFTVPAPDARTLH